ncbi:hypothetical protein LPB140_00975 [Sphingorhabdus lutea]|uniref:AB hydrolase-1 domain-containing protein n=1 Tax=Sphingorhabdus lutea TaxID=1913578 RepID=A0A1L3J953_9SPHN|nr:alpha/beta fold hydrolase [Sphingorhabdus lutea]APG61645.1 hypothetical protein LPB140_00975 [Sphingorhabdus lutea]
MTHNPPIIKGYSDSSFGQIHWRMAGENREEVDIFCLHPAPYSGLAYTNIMPHLAKNRRVFAPDYPGHGGSAPFRHDASINDYARAMAEILEELTNGRKTHLVGFHTGCLVAAELSIIAPQFVDGITIIDVPAFDAETRAKLLPKSGGEYVITPELSCLEPAWLLGMTKRIESQGVERSFEMFTEQLRHGRGRNAAFHAGFSYDVEGQFAKISCPVHIIASQSALLDATRRAATLIPHAAYVERTDIKRAVLDEAAEKVAAQILRQVKK